MYAIIREGNGKYYTSTVFGFFKSGNVRENYWIVLNKEKNRLIKQLVLSQCNKYMELMIKIVDCDESNWIGEDYGLSCVDWLPTENLIDMIETDTISPELLERCISEDASYEYVEYPEIKTQKDIDNLDWATGGFHDAYVDKIEGDSNSLYVLFDGIWSCKLEVWFEGDVTYDMKNREDDPYWFGGTVLIQDGYIYLIDDNNATVDDIAKGWCYFKAKKMKYHIIPN